MALLMARSRAKSPLSSEPGSHASRGSRGLRLASHEAHVERSKAGLRTVLLLLRSLTWSIRRVARMTAARLSLLVSTGAPQSQLAWHTWRVCWRINDK